MNRVGIDYKGAAAAEFYDPKPLLDPADESSQEYSSDAPDHRDQPALHTEYPLDQLVARSHVSERHDVFFLVYDKHGKGANDIKGGDNQNKGKDQEYSPLLRSHYPVEHLILLFPVPDPELVTHQGFHFILYCIGRKAWIQLCLQVSDFIPVQ